MIASGIWTRPAHCAPGKATLPGGRTWSGPAHSALRPPLLARRLVSKKVRRSLPPAPDIDRNWCLVVHSDLSASMEGGNDALGLRHEALLVLAEHLAVRRAGRRPSWHLRSHSFDNGGTCVDFGPIPLDRLNLSQVERALLGRTFGGSSNLGPSLTSSIDETRAWAEMGIVRIVMSDFELLDRDVPTVLKQLGTAPTDLTMALVFRAEPPAVLETGPVIVHRVDPSVDTPEKVAHLVSKAIVEVAGRG